MVDSFTESRRPRNNLSLVVRLLKVFYFTFNFKERD